MNKAGIQINQRNFTRPLNLKSMEIIGLCIRCSKIKGRYFLKKLGKWHLLHVHDMSQQNDPIEQTYIFM